MNKIKRGDIYWCNLDGNIGSEQGKTRPVLVISNNQCNEYSPVVAIAPITTKKIRRCLSTHVAIKNSNVVKDGVILCEQIRSVDIIRFGTYAGHMEKYIMDKVDKAIRIQLGI